MLDTVIGPVTGIMDGLTMKVQVTHIGRHNKFRYYDYETILIADKDPLWQYNVQERQRLMNVFLHRRVRCNIRFRDSYNRLVADVTLE